MLISTLPALPKCNLHAFPDIWTKGFTLNRRYILLADDVVNKLVRYAYFQPTKCDMVDDCVVVPVNRFFLECDCNTHSDAKIACVLKNMHNLK